VPQHEQQEQQEQQEQLPQQEQQEQQELKMKLVQPLGQQPEEGPSASELQPLLALEQGLLKPHISQFGEDVGHACLQHKNGTWSERDYLLESVRTGSTILPEP